MKTPSLLGLLALGLISTASAATFDFQDPKGVNNAQFLLDAPLETISGTANGVSGTVTFDPAKPASATGKIVVAAESLQVPNAMMADHMRGEKWLDAKKYPEISFELKSMEDVKQDGSTVKGYVTGEFSLRGVTKSIRVPVKVTYLPGRLKDRMPDVEGDLLVIRTEFTIKRSDFGIQAGQNEDKVSDEIKVSLAIAGAAPKA